MAEKQPIRENYILGEGINPVRRAVPIEGENHKARSGGAPYYRIIEGNLPEIADEPIRRLPEHHGLIERAKTIFEARRHRRK